MFLLVLNKNSCRKKDVLDDESISRLSEGYVAGMELDSSCAAAGELEGRGAGGVRGPVLEAGALRLWFPGPPREAGILLNFTKKPTPREG